MPQQIKHTLSNRLQRHWGAAIAVLLLFAFVFTAKVEWDFGDNRLSLISSQAILEHGNTRLDPYFEQCGADSITGGDQSSIIRLNGHFYYYFPVGTPLITVPLVAAGKLAGKDMAVREDAIFMRKVFCAITVSLLFLVLLRCAGFFMSTHLALLLAFGTALGSQMASTLALGNWSHNLTTLFIALMLLPLVRLHVTGKMGISGWTIGFFAFAAYLCRPPAVAWILPIFGCLLLLDRSAFLKASITTALLFAGFALWSHFEFGTWLPKYYMPGRLNEEVMFAEAFWGNLFSPARGIFMFQPLLALAVFAVLIRKLRRHWVFWVPFAGFFLQLILISRFGHWWGGWSFGPRLQSESIPGLFILLSAGASAIWSMLEQKGARIAFGTALGLLMVWGIFVHSVQGAYMPKSKEWNGSIDLYHDEYIWEWEFPQFFSGFQPENIISRQAIYRSQFKYMMQDVPEGVQYFFPISEGNFPFIRRLTRKFNKRKEFGERTIFVEWEQRVPNLPTYTNWHGKDYLARQFPMLECQPVKPYRNLAAVLEEADGQISFVVSNCANPKQFTDSTRSTLMRYKAEFLEHEGNIPLILLVRDKLIYLEKTANSGVVRHSWYHKHYSAHITAWHGVCESNPSFRFQNKPRHEFYANSFVFSLNDSTGVLTTVPMILSGTDVEANAVYRVQE